MRFVMKVDKDDCYQTAEITELSAVEVLIINKALRMMSKNQGVSENDRRIAAEMGEEILREDAMQRPLTAIDGAELIEQILDDGTLVVNVADATKVGRVLVNDGKQNGGLYYADAEPKGGTDCTDVDCGWK